MGSGSLTRLRVAFVLLGVALLAPLLFLLRAAEARFETQRQLRHEMVAERIFDEMEAELTALLERESQRPSSAYDAVDTRVSTWAPFVVGYFRSDLGGPHLLAQAQLSPERAARTTDAVTTLFDGVEAPLKERWIIERRIEQVEQVEQAEYEARQAVSRTGVSRANRIGKLSTSEARDAPPVGKPTRLKKTKHKPSPAARSRSMDSLLSEALESSQASPAAQAAPTKQDTAQVLRQLNRAGQKRKSARRKRPKKALSASRPSGDDPLSGLDGL